MSHCVVLPGTEITNNQLQLLRANVTVSFLIFLIYSIINIAQSVLKLENILPQPLEHWYYRWALLYPVRTPVPCGQNLNACSSVLL